MPDFRCPILDKVINNYNQMKNGYDETIPV
jgi:hypothetical protein